MMTKFIPVLYRFSFSIRRWALVLSRITEQMLGLVFGCKRRLLPLNAYLLYYSEYKYTHG